MRDGQLRKLAHGLFTVPKTGRFGPVPPDLDTLLTAFLEGASFVMTGPPAWNSLGLGTTALWTHHLVYNTKRTGSFLLDGQHVKLRRVRFPEHPPAEWFVIDLLESQPFVGQAGDDLHSRLVDALRAGRLDATVLRAMGAEYATAGNRLLLDAAIQAAQ
ncbi:MAG TPA: hypothetical protein VK188_06970 [Holophaga sp.]|nr:hypothetical protein [Holophaga sp.]